MLDKLNIKRIPAAVLVAAILFASVFSCAHIASAAAQYSARLEAPSHNNEYYYSDKNVFHKYGYGMPNCTAYAYGRAYEILKEEPKLCPYSAEEWYGYNKENRYYACGNTPKLGAVACWSYAGGGHVAVVEKIEDGTITFSNSAYSYQEFYLTTACVDDENAGQSGWDFQGYIYIGDYEASTQPTAPAEYQAGVYEVCVSGSLNMREGAGTGYAYLQSLYNGDIIEVTKTEYADGYTWGYTTVNGLNGWAALDYCSYISPLPEETPEPEPKTYSFNDVNYDGVLDISDATAIQMHLALINIFSDEQISLADFDGDGVLSINDATLLQMYLSKIH